MLEMSEKIPGVHQARQKRSIRIRDAYIQAGIELPNATRLQELKISDLAERCNCSVGSFYTRFEDKEAYFRALRVSAINACNAEIDHRVSVDKLEVLSPSDALAELVDLMADLFSGEFRGVLRESLLRILEPDDPWAPMRDSARRIMGNYHAALGHKFPQFEGLEVQRRLSFCFQLIVGALQNDLVNDYHVFSTRDQSLRNGLKDAVKKYMEVA